MRSSGGFLGCVLQVECLTWIGAMHVFVIIDLTILGEVHHTRTRPCRGAVPTYSHWGGGSFRPRPPLRSDSGENRHHPSARRWERTSARARAGALTLDLSSTQRCLVVGIPSVTSCSYSVS